MPGSHREAAMLQWVLGLGFTAPLEGSLSCGILWLSKQTRFSVDFFFLSFLLACMVSNSILIVYIAPAALHNKVTAISSPLPSSFLVPSIPIHSPLHWVVVSIGLYLLPLFSLHTLPLPPPPMLSLVLKGWMMAKSEPRQCSAAQKALYQPVPRSCWAAILYFMSRWSAPSINMAPS